MHSPAPLTEHQSDSSSETFVADALTSGDTTDAGLLRNIELQEGAPLYMFGPSAGEIFAVLPTRLLASLVLAGVIASCFVLAIAVFQE